MNAHFARGEALFNIKRYDQAVSAFHSALADDPNDAITHAMLGAALVNRQQTDAAHDAVRRALQIDPQSAYAHYVLSVVELQRLQFDLAEKAVAESLRLDQSADVLLQAATLAQINGRIEDALAFTAEALRLDPQHSQSILFRGKLLAGESRFDEAHALYASALANTLKTPRPITRLAHCGFDPEMRPKHWACFARPADSTRSVQTTPS